MSRTSVLRVAFSERQDRLSSRGELPLSMSGRTLARRSACNVLRADILVSILDHYMARLASAMASRRGGVQKQVQAGCTRPEHPRRQRQFRAGHFKGGEGALSIQNEELP